MDEGRERAERGTERPGGAGGERAGIDVDGDSPTGADARSFAPVLLEPEEARTVAEQCGVPAPLARLNVFRLLLADPQLAAGVSSLLIALVGGDGLDPRLRELAILRVAWGRRSTYEWTQHWHIATALGVDGADLAALRGDPSRLGPLEQALVRAADEVTASGQVSAPTLATLRRSLDEREVLLLVAVLAAWSMVAIVLETFGVPLEDGVAPWPPDGRAPG